MLSSNFLSLIVCAVAFTSTSAQDTTVYSTWAADSAIARGQGNGLANGSPIVSYEHGELWWGLQLLFEKTGDSKYYDYILAGAQNIVDEDGNIADAYRYVFIPMLLRLCSDMALVVSTITPRILLGMYIHLQHREWRH